MFPRTAQEEPNTISQNTKMGIAYRFQEGKVIVNHNKFLGYTKDENGELVIVPEEAEVVRRIYREFLDGSQCVFFRDTLRHCEASGHVETIVSLEKRTL